MDKIDKIGCFVLILLIVVGLPTAWMIETHKPYTETPILNKQYLGNITAEDGGDCNNCLIMDVTHFGINKTYYFV